MQALIDALSQHPALALGAVFAAALLEAVAVIGTVIPGSSVVFAGGLLVGLQVLDPWWTALAAVSGAICGDGFSFWLGRRYHERLRKLWPIKAYPALYERGHDYFERNGGKSVFLARFLGPLRAIVPVIAGMSTMSVPSFMVVNATSALAWAAAHLLPGVLFGASLQLAGAMSSRLLILLVGVLVATWLSTLLLRLTHRSAWPVVARQRDRVVAWARARTGLASRVVLSLLDPARPESPGLLVAALLLLGGSWLFLGILEDVLTKDAFVMFDQVAFTALQNLRTAWADDVMMVATEIGSAVVAVAVIAAVAVVLAVKRCWRTLAYWLTAVGFAQALVWVLKTTLGRARPIAMYDGIEQFSFPSGHAASSIVLYGFLAVLLARYKSPTIRLTLTGVAALVIGLISFSRLYLGAHWLSDVLASLSLGTAWVALLSIVYLQHVRDEHLPVRDLSLAALVALVLAGAGVVATRHAADLVRYAPRQATLSVLLPDWRAEGWRQLPARRTEMSGDFEEPMSLQWRGTADPIERVLVSDGWRRPPPWASRAALLWLLPSTPVGELPVLVKFHGGVPPALSLEKELDPARRLVIRLWATSFQVDEAGAGVAPLWIGMVTLERLKHPARIVTLALTDPDFALASAQLARLLQTQGLALDIRHRDGIDVLLIQ